ncbi:MAG: DUF6132 family protein [Bacteroidota bacterium]
MNIKEYFNKILWTRLITGVVIGGVAGFVYYYFVGCKSGTCAVTSNPYISILYGILLGSILTFKIKKSTE